MGQDTGPCFSGTDVVAASGPGATRANPKMVYDARKAMNMTKQAHADKLEDSKASPLVMAGKLIKSAGDHPMVQQVVQAVEALKTASAALENFDVKQVREHNFQEQQHEFEALANTAETCYLELEELVEEFQKRMAGEKKSAGQGQS